MTRRARTSLSARKTLSVTIDLRNMFDMRGRNPHCSAVLQLVVVFARLVSAAATALQLELGSSSLAKPGRLPWANEDASFTARPFAAVFDGVSAAPRSRAFAATLATATRDVLVAEGPDGSWSAQAQYALRRAASAAASINGAATACLVRFDLARGQVDCFNLGDSGFLLLGPTTSTATGLRVLGRSVARVHRDGAPFQLAGGAGVSDSVTSGLVSTHQLAAGQIALCFTDGLSRNLPTDEIARLVERSARLPPARMASLLAREAMARDRARDDVTVIVARLRSRRLQ